MDTGIRHSLKRSHAEDSALSCQALKVHMRAGFRSLGSGFRTHIEETSRGSLISFKTRTTQRPCIASDLDEHLHSVRSP
jgi:hypothetical protein